MPQAAAAPRVPWLDDPRVLLANPELEAVLLATSTRQNAALAAVAAGVRCTSGTCRHWRARSRKARRR